MAKWVDHFLLTLSFKHVTLPIHYLEIDSVTVALLQTFIIASSDLPPSDPHNYNTSAFSPDIIQSSFTFHSVLLKYLACWQKMGLVFIFHG